MIFCFGSSTFFLVTDTINEYNFCLVLSITSIFRYQFVGRRFFRFAPSLFADNQIKLKEIWKQNNHLGEQNVNSYRLTGKFALGFECQSSQSVTTLFAISFGKVLLKQCRLHKTIDTQVNASTAVEGLVECFVVFLFERGGERTKFRRRSLLQANRKLQSQNTPSPSPLTCAHSVFHSFTAVSPSLPLSLTLSRNKLFPHSSADNLIH